MDENKIAKGFYTYEESKVGNGSDQVMVGNSTRGLRFYSWFCDSHQLLIVWKLWKKSQIPNGKG